MLISHLTGGRKCPDWRHTLHHERPTGVSDILADLQHHGSEPLCGQVREVCEPNGIHTQCLHHQ